MPVVAETVVLGADLPRGQRPQATVPGGTWQSAVPYADAPTVVSCVVSPGFDFADFRLA
jgi:predicted cupin superfamily sugar epimerase